MIRAVVLSVAVICVLSDRTASAELPELVGDLGAPEKIVFHGQKIFDQRQLRDAVAGNLKLIIAGHPHAKFQSFLDQLQNQVKSGYLHAGFHDVVVKSRYDEARDTVELTIHEGPQYRCGKIEIDGQGTVPPERIRNFLMQSERLKSSSIKLASGTSNVRTDSGKTSSNLNDSGLWDVGHPASFSDTYRRNVAAAISRCFQQFGYYRSDVAFEIRPERDGTATLAVTIQSEGPQALLGHVDVSGTKKNTHADVIRFLGLNKGMPLNSLLTESTEQKLRMTGRFVMQKVEVIQPGNDESVKDIKITIVESPLAPPLKRELSPVEQAALRVQGWLEGLAHSDEDFVAEARYTIKTEVEGNAAPKGKSWNPFQNRMGSLSKRHANHAAVNDAQWTYVGKIALSPSRRETLIQLQIVQQPETVLFDTTLTLQNKLLILESDISKTRCTLSMSESHFVGQINLISFPPDKDGDVCRMTFGLGVASDTSKKSALRVTCDPACVIHTVEKWKDRFKMEGDQLVFDNHDEHCSFDAKSGRLLGCSGVVDYDGKVEFKIECGPGLFDRHFADRRHATAGWNSMRLDETPFACLISLLAGNNGQTSAAQASESTDRLLRIAQRWQKQERSNPIFEQPAPTETNGSRVEDFFIPLDAQTTAMTAFMYEVGFRLLSSLIPKESSTWTILREFAFVSLGQYEHTQAVLQSVIESSDSGPIANLVAGAIFGMASPKMRVQFAKRGLQKLSLADFQADYQPFLTSDVAIGRSLLSLGSLLKGCTDQEIVDLVELMSLDEGAPRDAVIRSLSHFPKHRDRTSKEVITMALDELWEPIIRPQVESLLTSFRGQEPKKSLLRIGKK